MAAARTPNGLAAGGKALWTDITDAHELDPSQRVQLIEACRAKDRLDKLDRVLRGDVATWATIDSPRYEGAPIEIVVDKALDKANTTANLLKQLLAALRLPDAASGKRPQQRGGARGAYEPRSAGAGSVTPIERARQRAAG